MSSSRRLVPNGRRFAVALLLAFGAAACSQGGAAPQAGVTAGPATPAPTPTNGPAAYADWVARQGFGGSSGLNNVLKLAKWLSDNASNATTYDITADRDDIARLISWLDEHPATACWTAYHQHMQTELGSLATLYDRAIAERTSGPYVPYDIAQEILAAAQVAFDEPAPAGCL